MRLAFGDCVFDSGTREVFRGGRPTPLSPKAFQFLEVLIGKRPNAVSKEELQQILWPKTFVTEANLPNLVGELRGELGDDARTPHVIRTVRGFGYAFIAVAQAFPSSALSPAEGPIYRLIWGDREIALALGENVIGRAADSVLFIDHSSVSRRHARILVDTTGAVLEDLGSKNGTLLRGKRVHRAQQLADRDSIEIGPASLVFRIFRHTESTASKSR
jgi:DNA-binding winged helix-turn-helix (wHTH) protein